MSVVCGVFLKYKRCGLSVTSKCCGNWCVKEVFLTNCINYIDFDLLLILICHKHDQGRKICVKHVGVFLKYK